MPRPVRESVTPYTGTTAPHTYQHTVGVGQSLVVTARFVDDATTFGATATYNGVAGTLVAASPRVSFGYMATWFWPSPASGENTLIIAPVTSTSQNAAVLAVNYSGVAGTDPIGAEAGFGDAGAGTSRTHDVASNADSVVLWAIGSFEASDPFGGATPTAGHALLGPATRNNATVYGVQGDGETLTTIGMSWDLDAGGTHGTYFSLAGESGTLPGAPSITAAATSWDALQVTLAEMPTGADEVRVYASTTSPAATSDELVHTFTAPGTAFVTQYDGGLLLAATQYFLLPVAADSTDTQNGNEVAATTFADTAVATSTTGDPISWPFTVEAGTMAVRVDIDLGKIARTQSGFDSTVDFLIVVEDSENVEVGNETFTDVPIVDGGESFLVWLDYDPLNRNETDAVGVGAGNLEATVTPTITAP